MIVMNKIRFAVLMAVLLVLNFARPTPSYGQATPNSNWPPIQGFHLVSPTEGWVWTSRLYWTKDGGQTWTDITPPGINGMELWAVSFVDAEHGGVIAATIDSTGVTYFIIKTSDGGKTWTIKPLS